MEASVPTGAFFVARPGLPTADQGSRARWPSSAHSNRSSSALLLQLSDELAGLDLRKLSVTDHIKPALAKAKAEAHRIAALEAIYSWLRKEKLSLTVAEDPTFQTLMVPQAKPEQWKRVKAVAREHFLAARKQLASLWQDAVDIQAGTGWHISELQRFAEGGAIESYPGKPTRGVAGVLVCPQTKGGEPLRTAVSRPRDWLTPRTRCAPSGRRGQRRAVAARRCPRCSKRSW